MKKVITYGTYDLLHYGHIRLLERAKALGDYLIVGVTSDDFDRTRGKINVQQSLIERIEAVKALKIADKIIVEEYEGQKIDDIKKYNVDIFTVGSDWKGQFDYLSEYCQVVYLDRTQGVSSSSIRSSNHSFRIGLVGEAKYLNKFYNEAKFVNGVRITCIYSMNINNLSLDIQKLPSTNNYDELLEKVDAVHIHSDPAKHFEQVKKALLLNKNVMCEEPISMTEEETKELFSIAKKNNVILHSGLRTAYLTGFSRMLALLKSGIIGKIVNVSSVCTSLSNDIDAIGWDSLTSWGPIALLPVFSILGTDYKSKTIVTSSINHHNTEKGCSFAKIDFDFESSVASVIVSSSVKSEGSLVISGTKGYVYVPSPWWKTDYFEARFENFTSNKKYFYQYDGDGIRYEIADFIHKINHETVQPIVDEKISIAISKIVEEVNKNKHNIIISE